MKKIVLISLLFSNLAYAKEELISYDAFCDNTKIIVEKIKEYNEVPVALGNSVEPKKSKLSLWMNPTTKSWTLISTHGDTTCVLGIGEKMKIVLPGSTM